MVDIYQDASGEWRWRVMADNGKIVADSSEGYHNKRDCIHGLHVTARQILEAAISGGLLEVEAEVAECVERPDPPAPRQD
jgi:uncharacterized protein YegP (UPF0339 family)